MLVQDKHGTRYRCHARRQKSGVPVGQHMPADGIDDAVVQAFFPARSPVELDLYARAMAAQHHPNEKVECARTQRLERRRYPAALAPRQDNRCDPDTRVVAAAREARGEAALRARNQAEEVAPQERTPPRVPFALTAERKTACSKIGERLPHIWEPQILSPPQRKAWLRGLMDQVALPRVGRAHAHVRLVWRGGETTTRLVPVRVRRWAALPGAAEMERSSIDLFTHGYRDEEMAKRLTARGHRSPTCPYGLPNTVKIIRLKPRLVQPRSQSPPRRMAGDLTVPQVARALEVPVHWIYDHINRGPIEIPQDDETRRSVFPDRSTTLQQFKELKSGERRPIRCR